MTKTFSKKQKSFMKDKKKTQNVEETQPTPTNNKNYHTEKSKYSQPCQARRCLSAKQAVF